MFLFIHTILKQKCFKCEFLKMFQFINEVFLKLDPLKLGIQKHDYLKHDSNLY